MGDAHEGLQKVARWIPTYFGFGTCIVHVIRGDDVCIEAVQNGPPRLYVGRRYPRASVYCDDVIASGSTLILTDPAHHPSELFAHHPELQKGWRFYAGAPLTAPSGAVFGNVCLLETSPPRERLPKTCAALGAGAGRELEKDEDGAFGRDYLQMFVDVVMQRAARAGCAGTIASIRACRPAPEAMGLAVVRADATRMLLLWGGSAGAWAPDGTLAERVLDKVELPADQDSEAARARAICE